MQPENNKLMALAEIFVKYFPEHVVFEFKDQVRIGDTFIAEQLFNPAWRHIKDELFTKKIPYTKKEVEIFLNSVIGTEAEISTVWHDILAQDPDFLYLERMSTDQLLQKKYDASDNEAEKENLNREDSLKYIIRQTFLRTGAIGPGQMERLEWAFNEEIKLFLEALTKRQVATNVDELIRLFQRELPVLKAPGALYILNGINRYDHVLESIKLRKIEPDEFIIKIDQAKLLEEIEAEWEIADIESQATVEAQPVDTLEIRQRDFSAVQSKEIFDVTKLEISAKGIKEAMESIIFNFGPDEFFERIKMMHERIKIHCRDKNLLEPLVTIIFKLKSGYERNFQKSLDLLTEKANKMNANITGLEKKIKFIISALGVFWAFLEEAIRIEKTNNGKNGNH